MKSSDSFSKASEAGNVLSSNNDDKDEIEAARMQKGKAIWEKYMAQQKFVKQDTMKDSVQEQNPQQCFDSNQSASPRVGMFRKATLSSGRKEDVKKNMRSQFFADKNVNSSLSSN